MASSDKQYGLILPTKKGLKKELKTAAVFGAVHEENEPNVDDKATERRRVAQEASRSFHQSQVLRTHEKALAEDASVFDYDGVYDQIQSSRQDKKAQRQAQREAEKQQPKYIAALLEKAKVREIEHERIRERRLLKERAAEDAQFGDKEKLISASYKRKLQEMQRWDEEDKRMEVVEAAEDVTKRGDNAMAGFYSNLLTKNLAMGGASSNACSAYTVGKGDGGDRECGEKRVKYESEAATSRGDETSSRVEKAETYPRPEIDTHPVAVASREGPSVLQSSKPVEPPPPSKDEIVSAARARFLARKAAKMDQSTQS